METLDILWRREEEFNLRFWWKFTSFSVYTLYTMLKRMEQYLSTTIYRINKWVKFVLAWEFHKLFDVLFVAV